MIRTNFSIRLTPALKPYIEINLLAETFVFSGDQNVEFSLSEFDEDEIIEFLDGGDDDIRFQVSKLIAPDIFEIEAKINSYFVVDGSDEISTRISGVSIEEVSCDFSLSVYGVELDFEYDDLDNNNAEAFFAKMIGA